MGIIHLTKRVLVTGGAEHDDIIARFDNMIRRMERLNKICDEVLKDA